MAKPSRGGRCDTCGCWWARGANVGPGARCGDHPADKPSPCEGRVVPDKVVSIRRDPGVLGVSGSVAAGRAVPVR